MEACVAAAARQLRPVDLGNPRADRRRILAPGASGVCPAQCGLLARDHRTAIAGNWPGGIVSAESSDAFPGFVRIESDRVAT